MGYYQTPICKWGKRPITVMGVAEDYGHKPTYVSFVSSNIRTGS